MSLLEPTHTTPIAYHITPIQNPPTNVVIESYREVRLAALRTDPEYFSSTYEREAAFAEETRRERLTGSGKATFVAQASVRAGEEGKEGSGGYVGMVTVIAGRNIGASAVPPGADAGKTYFVFGMWVRPEHRRGGVGRRLMERMLVWAGNDAKESGSTGRTGRGVDGFETWLAVKSDNEPAKKLYGGLGFRKVEEGLEEDEEFWMRIRLEEADDWN